MVRSIRSIVARVVPPGIMVLLGLNTLMGCWCWVIAGWHPGVDAEKPVAERSVTSFARR